MRYKFQILLLHLYLIIQTEMQLGKNGQNNGTHLIVHQNTYYVEKQKYANVSLIESL